MFLLPMIERQSRYMTGNLIGGGNPVKAAAPAVLPLAGFGLEGEDFIRA
ncbi:hypothetical protein KMT30_23385 [Streptomyces sp. IBSBF 2953]|nr:hypothetical protein [Streptomyces scabiei]MCQ9181940.1 hypothetical protein [Streptomyces hayashii]MDX3113808.1 hypothetical protein [Streptomyces scabiei]